MKVLLYTVFKDLTTAGFVASRPHDRYRSLRPLGFLAGRYALDGDLFENTMRSRTTQAYGLWGNGHIG